MQGGAKRHGQTKSLIYCNSQNVYITQIQKLCDLQFWNCDCGTAPWDWVKKANIWWIGTRVWWHYIFSHQLEHITLHDITLYLRLPTIYYTSCNTSGYYFSVGSVIARWCRSTPVSLWCLVCYVCVFHWLPTEHVIEERQDLHKHLWTMSCSWRQNVKSSCNVTAKRQDMQNHGPCTTVVKCKKFLQCHC